MSDIKQIQAEERAARQAWLKEKKKESQKIFDMHKNNIHMRFAYIEKKLDIIYQVISGKDLQYPDGTIVRVQDIPYPHGNFREETFRIAKQTR